MSDETDSESGPDETRIATAKRIPDNECVAVTWTGTDTRRRRLVFEPRGNGTFARVTQRRTNAGAWVDTSVEIVTDLDVTAGPSVER
jgi:hypothetical protein